MQSKTNTVCILAAGSCTRMGRYSELTHKALLPISGVAAISIIIQKFLTQIGRKTRFVIAVGFCARDVIDYVELAHPDILVDFVHINGFAERGSGPGQSALDCRSFLNGAFYLVCCDTLWSGINCSPEHLNRDWIAVAPVCASASADYCNVRVKDSHVLEFRNKERVAEHDFFAFTGLAHIANPTVFFQSLMDAKSRSLGLELMDGFSGLRSANGGPGLFACEMQGWQDIGTLDRYESQVSQREGPNFEKIGEYFYCLNGRVIKFFSDPKIVADRIRRSESLKNVVPRLTGRRERFYSYDYINGIVLYNCITPFHLNRLLRWLEQNLWKEVEITNEERTNRSLKFYREKTCARLNSLFSRAGWPGIERDQRRILALMELVPWATLALAKPVVFHGDLQFDNIIYDSKSSQFKLIDWRQDFSGALNWGDLYYDISKLNACIEFDFHGNHIRSGNSALRHILAQAISRHRLDPERVKIITALIYLNMAGIHLKPLDKIFFTEGLCQLEKLLGTKGRGQAIVSLAR